MDTGAVLDLLKFHSFALASVREISSFAFVVAPTRETGFIYRDRGLETKIADAGYETLVSMKDAKTGLYSAVCQDPTLSVVERVLSACVITPQVSVVSMVASEQDGRLEMPALTVASEVRDKNAPLFPWIEGAVKFANKCSRYADLSVPGRAKYTLNSEVKRAWNEFHENSFGLFLYAPRYNVTWREELGTGTGEEERHEPALKNAEVIKRMRAHPKEDKGVDVSSFRESPVTDWRRTG